MPLPRQRTDPTERGPLPEGERFEVLRELGSGALSRVELVRDRRDGSLYARKSIALPEEERLGLLRREFLLRARIAHPQVPAAHLLVRDEREGRAWCLFDHVEGEDLLRALRTREPAALPVLLLQALLQALNAIAWVHRRGVIHGDVKPDNLCVGAGGEDGFLLRLLDFGTAIDRQAGETESRGGTPAYLAPWVRETGRADPRADLYALGRTFAEALAVASAPEPERDELAGFLARLAHPDPDLAFPSAEAALAHLRGLFPALGALRLPRPAEPEFCGRATERAWFDARREMLQAGMLRENVLLVRGATGSGRTRLLQEFERACLLAGLATARVQGGASGPEALAELVTRALSPGRVSGAELARSLAPDGAGPSQRLLRDLARAFKEEGARRPLVVLVDDLEHAGESVLQFLRMFARLEAATGPIFVATWNEAAGAPPFEVGDAVDELRLAPIVPSELRRVAASLFLERECDALPLSDWIALARGAVGVLAALARAADPTRAERASGAPDPLQALLDLRLAGVGTDERSALGALAILARPAPLGVLARVAGLSETAALRALDALLPAGLVESEVQEGGRRFALAARLLEEPLARALSADERRALHARALEALEAWPFPAERPMDALVRHALGAGQVERAVELGCQAARLLLGRGALRAAEELAELVLVHARSGEVRAELSILAAEAKLRAGRPREARAVLAGLEPWLAGRPDGELVPSVLWLVGASAEAEGELELAREVLGRALEASADAPIEIRQRVHERLGAVHYRAGDLARARRTWEEGLALSAPDERTRMRGELLNDLGVLDWREGALDEARARHELALSVRREIGDLDGEARSLTNLATVAARRGDFRAAAEYYEESLRLKRLVGSLASQSLTLRNLGSLYRNRGDYGRAVACLRESIDQRARVGDRLAAAATRRQLALLLLEKGEVRAALAELEEARGALSELRAPPLERAALRETECAFALQQGRREDALALVDLGFEELGPAASTSLRPSLLRLRARARGADGDPAASRADLEQALAEGLALGDPWEIGQGRLALGVVLGRLGEDERAAQEVRGAIELARSCEMTPLLAEALLAEYDLSARRGLAAGAVRSLVEGERLALRLGFPLLELSAWSRMGEHALECGFVARAVQWWRKGVERLQGLVEEYAAEQRARILAQPEHRRLVQSLSAILGGGPPPGPLPGQGELAGLLTQAQGFGEPAEGGGRRSLRPEILTRLLEISRSMNALHRRDEILSYLRDRMVELFGAENSQIILVGRDGSYRSLGEASGSAERPFSVTLLDRVLEERRPILIQDTRHDPELFDKKSVHLLGLVSVLCAPLVVDEEVLGILQFDHRSRPGPFTEEDLAVLELFAHQAATALKNLLLVERLAESADRIRESEARLHAGERLRALGEMSAGVAHDFNNLLTIITGITDLMLTNRGLPPDVRADLEVLDSVSKTAGATVRRLQAFRGHAPQLETRTRLDPSEVARQAAEIGRRRFAGLERHELVLDLAAVPGVLGQEAELRDVLLNLIINGYEAMPDGGPIVVRTREEQGAAVIEVEDRGTGVAPELRSVIFEPFFSTKPAGQGLGLWQARSIVHRMGGRVACLAAEGGGARFRIELPAAAGVPASALPVFPGRAVLVVDDDPKVRELLARMLELAGLHPRCTPSGAEALALFEREPFDLVLTDYAMPGMNGAEVAREIKRRRADCPVVLLTGRSAEGFVPPRVGETFSLILEKPITREKLAAALALPRD